MYIIHLLPRHITTKHKVRYAIFHPHHSSPIGYATTCNYLKARNRRLAFHAHAPARGVEMRPWGWLAGCPERAHRIPIARSLIPSFLRPLGLYMSVGCDCWSRLRGGGGGGEEAASWRGAWYGLWAPVLSAALFSFATLVNFSFGGAGGGIFVWHISW